MKILIAEDELFYRHLLVSTVREWGYEPIARGNGLAAGEHLLARLTAPKIAILDWMMPRMDGLEVCRRLRALVRPEPTYVIMLTAAEGKENIVTALESGADDFVTKPFDREELRARIRVGPADRRPADEPVGRLRVRPRGRGQEPLHPGPRRARHGVCRGPGGASWPLGRRRGRPSARGPAARHRQDQHSRRHPGQARQADAEEMRDHRRSIPVEGVKIIEPLQSLHDVIPLVRWHHERLDGRGYPDGLEGDAIPLLVRILSVADVYDALSSDRPYRAALPHAESLGILRENARRGDSIPSWSNGSVP